MAAEAIQGCKARPRGMKIPKTGTFTTENIPHMVLSFPSRFFTTNNINYLQISNRLWSVRNHLGTMCVNVCEKVK